MLNYRDIVCSTLLGMIVAIVGMACAGKRVLANPPHLSSGHDDPGRASVGAAELEEILQGLSKFKERASQYTPDEWSFVLGYAHYKRGNFEDADRFFQKVESSLPLLRDHVLYYRAVIANRLDRGVDAAGFLDALGRDHPDSVWAGGALVERARALIGMGDHAAARDMLDRARRGADSEALREIDMLMADSLIGDGQREGAIAYVKAMAIRSGCEGELAEAADMIRRIRRLFGYDIDRWLDDPRTQYRLAQSFVDRSQWDEAASRLKKLIDRQEVDSETRANARWLLARCLRWTHRYDEAIALMEGLLADPYARGFSHGLMSTLATTYAKKDDYDKAIAIRQKLMDASPRNSRFAALMAYKIAFLHMDRGDYRKAIQLWQRVINMRSDRKMHTMAKWHLAWCHYRAGDHEQTLSMFDDILGRVAKRARIEDRVRYWKGVVLEKLGMRSEARETFREIKKEHPNGYYAELSTRRLEGDRRSAKDFARASARRLGRGSWAPEGWGDGTGSGHLRRAILLDRLGLHEEVGRELRAIDFKKRPDEIDMSMWLASRNFAHNLPLSIAESRYRRLLRGLTGTDDFTVFIWEMAHPRAYRPLVERLAKENGIDPLLVWSIMRIESAYRPDAVSSAGAVGLMQLMPTTANRVASGIGLGSVDQRELRRPAKNISLGIAYLRTLSELFPDNPAAAIASYSAGEEAVGRWLKDGRAFDIEEWIEDIPYSETNLYVKMVLTSYWNFQRLYQNQEPKTKSKNTK